MTRWTAAAQTLGTLGAICWSVQLLPQIWKNYSAQSTVGLQPSMMILWALAGIPLGVYNITRSFPIPLQIQPQILTLLSLITWSQCYFYTEGTGRTRWSLARCISMLLLLGTVFAGIEAGIVVALRSRTENTQLQYWWPVVLMGVLAGVLLCAGVSRHYVDIYRERTVRGVSFLFCGLDALGDLTSLISVVLWYKAGRSLDVLGIGVYASEFVLWSGVFACGAWFNLRPWLRSRLTRTSNQPDIVDGPGRGQVTDSRRSSQSSVFRTAAGEENDDRIDSIVRLRTRLYTNG